MRASRTTSVKPNTASSQDIIKLHTNLVGRFRAHIPDPIVIGTDRSTPDGWKKTAITNDPIRFFMWNKPGPVGQIRAVRKRDRSDCPILPLEVQEGQVPWVAWYEEWLPSQHRRGEFEFKTASLTFFWEVQRKRPNRYLERSGSNLNMAQIMRRPRTGILIGRLQT